MDGVKGIGHARARACSGAYLAARHEEGVQEGVHELPRVEVHVELHRDERAMAQRSARRVTSGKIDARSVAQERRAMGQRARVEGSGQ
jgi:hypothetical protein